MGCLAEQGLLFVTGVREYAGAGHLLHNRYHDGKNLRFEWDDATRRNTLRDMRKKGFQCEERDLEEFADKWFRWDKQQNN
jgi:hypothetical protein